MENDPQGKLQRQSLREHLLAARGALADRVARERTLRQHAADWLARADVRALAFYFPIRGEPDLREIVADWLEADRRRVAGLPVVTGSVLGFRAWTRDAPMRAAEFGVPVPAQGRPVQPDALLIPCVGFDAQRYRLGYGGGYYDRTLAQIVPWPLTVGIAFESARVASIDPQAHDMRLDAVITEAGIEPA